MSALLNKLTSLMSVDMVENNLRECAYNPMDGVDFRPGVRVETFYLCHFDIGGSPELYNYINSRISCGMVTEPYHYNSSQVYQIREGGTWRTLGSEDLPQSFHTLFDRAASELLDEHWMATVSGPIEDFWETFEDPRPVRAGFSKCA